MITSLLFQGLLFAVATGEATNQRILCSRCVLIIAGVD